MCGYCSIHSLFQHNPKVLVKKYVEIGRNVVISQPELRMMFLSHFGQNRLGYCVTRMIWNKFVRRNTYLEAIEDLGDEYLNHKFIFIKIP